MQTRSRRVCSIEWMSVNAPVPDVTITLSSIRFQHPAQRIFLCGDLHCNLLNFCDNHKQKYYVFNNLSI